jgi:hypothetical protein
MKKDTENNKRLVLAFDTLFNLQSMRRNGVVELIATHEASYLEHCRKCALKEMQS